MVALSVALLCSRSRPDQGRQMGSSWPRTAAMKVRDMHEPSPLDPSAWRGRAEGAAAVHSRGSACNEARGIGAHRRPQARTRTREHGKDRGLLQVPPLPSPRADVVGWVTTSWRRGEVAAAEKRTCRCQSSWYADTHLQRGRMTLNTMMEGVALTLRSLISGGRANDSLPPKDKHPMRWGDIRKRRP